MEAQRVLPGEPGSASRARRFTEQTLQHWHHEELSELVTLLVSELVTNAVLHAGSDIKVRLALEPGAVRLEVHDTSPVLPAESDYGQDASTGRGLGLVSALAQSWGAETSAWGKVVWCTLPAETVPEAVATTAPAEKAVGEPRGDGEPTGGPARVVHLAGVPLSLYRAMRQHNDALLREAALVAFGEGADLGASEPLAVHAAVVGCLAGQIVDATMAGAATADVAAELAADALARVPALRAALDEADALARRGALLTPPALPEVRACRHWLLDELAAQHAGAPPTPWSGQSAADTADGHLRTAVEHAVVLDAISDGVLVGDESNRITYANTAVEELLGWPSGGLVGRRITVVVPERLRDAHVAGYSRYLITGQPTLVGTPVRVPARRRDGSEVPVELRLSVAHEPGRRPVFVACLRDVTDRAHVERDTSVTAAVHALRDVVASLTAHRGELAGAASAVLDILGSRLPWEFAAAYGVDGQALACLSIWPEDPATLPHFRQLTVRQRFTPGLGLPGRVWESGQPTWITDVVADANFPRAGAALEEGLRSAVGVPVLRTDEVVGVIELYTSRTIEVDVDLMAVLAAVGEVVGALTVPSLLHKGG